MTNREVRGMLPLTERLRHGWDVVKSLIGVPLVEQFVHGLDVRYGENADACGGKVLVKKW